MDNKLDFKILDENFENNKIKIFLLEGILKKSTTKNFLEILKKFISEGTNIFIFDMKNLLLIDNSGMEFLVELASANELFNIKFFLVSLHNKISVLLRSIGLDAIYHFKNDVEEVIFFIKNEIETKQTQEELNLTPEDKEFLSVMEEKIKSKNYNIPVLPDIAIKLSELLSASKASISDVMQLIASDPSITTQVLKTANLSIYSGRFPVTSLQTAITRLGIKKTKSIVFAISMKSTIFKGKGIDILVRDIWRHSINCALLSEYMIKKSKIKTEDDLIFTSSLLHDIHKIIILALCREILLKKNQNYFPPKILLENIYNDYKKIIFLELSKKWNLHSSIQNNIINFFEKNFINKEVSLIHLCNDISKFCEKKFSFTDDIPELKSLNISKEEFDSDVINSSLKLYENVKEIW